MRSYSRGRVRVSSTAPGAALNQRSPCASAPMDNLAMSTAGFIKALNASGIVFAMRF